MREQAMGSEKIWKLCLTMGMPCVLAQVVNLLYNIVDRIYIGNMEDIGAAALGGLGLCSPIITLIAAFSAFVSGGGAPLAAKSLGEENTERARRILNNGFLMLVFFSLSLGLAAYFCAGPLLNLIGAGDSNFGYAYDYLTVYLIGTLFVQLATGLNTFLTAQGRSLMAMISVMVGAALNIGLDPLFIFTFGMGVQGAAIATVISQFASALFVVLALRSKKLTLRLTFAYMKPDIKIIGAILSLGVASFVMSATESVIGFVLNGRLKYYGDMTDIGGDYYVSVLAVLQSAMMLITTPISGFTQGVTPRNVSMYLIPKVFSSSKSRLYTETGASSGISGGFGVKGYRKFMYTGGSYPVLCHVEGTRVSRPRSVSVSTVSGTREARL